MPGSWLDRLDKETILAALRVVGLVAGAITAAFGGSAIVEGRAQHELAEAEAEAAVGNARVEKFDSLDSYADFATRVQVQRAACDSALEAFARHRDDDRDFEHVVAECHSEGGLE